jgi:NADH-quinone oxidoreductase subunit F
MAFRFMQAKSGNLKFIVCNADEGDREHIPTIHHGTAPARTMGMMIGLYLRAWGGIHPRRIRRSRYYQRCVGLAQSGCSAKHSDRAYDFKIIEAQGAYICGEETALLSSIEGQRREVRVRPPYHPAGFVQQAHCGQQRGDTANLPLSCNTAAARDHRYPKSTGSTGTSTAGIYEVDMGTPLSTVIHDLGGGFCKPVKAMHIGGPLGGLVPVHKIDALTVDFDSLHEKVFAGTRFAVCIPRIFRLFNTWSTVSVHAHELRQCFPAASALRGLKC